MSLCRVALLALVLGCAFQAAQAQTSKARLVVFGDDLVDDGDGARLYAQNYTNNPNLVFPPAPYQGGRFTNGPVISEYLAQYLNLTLYNFADGGASSGATPSFFSIQNNTLGVSSNIATPKNIGVPNTLNQSTNYVNLTTGRISATDYYALVVGSNDYLNINGGANATVADVISYIRQAAVALYSGGVRRLIIAEVPPLQLTPFATSIPTKVNFTSLVTQHNANLTTLVQNLTATYPQGTFAVAPVYSIVSSIAANPTRYGFTNATQCYGTAATPIPTGGAAQCASAAAHIFWDRLNPTTNVHQLVAATIAKEVAAVAGVPALAPAGLAAVPAPATLVLG